MPNKQRTRHALALITVTWYRLNSDLVLILMPPVIDMQNIDVTIDRRYNGQFTVEPDKSCQIKDLGPDHYRHYIAQSRLQLT